MSDPQAPTRISATIKVSESERYKSDNPWLVFEGSSPKAVKALIVGATGMKDADDLTLVEVVNNAQTEFSGLRTAAQGLGGRSTSSSKSSSSGSSAPKEEPEEKEEVSPFFAQIEAATTRAEVKQVWAENKAAFDANPALMEAYKAKGKSLPA